MPVRRTITEPARQIDVAAALSVRAERALDDVDIAAVQAELNRQNVWIS